MAAPTEPQQGGVPTLHHLNNSQSQRILWFLEELGIEYHLELYLRDPKRHRAPPDLQKVQALGKAPILVTADGRAISESSAIVAYLLRTYDAAGAFVAEDWIRDEVLTSFAGSSLGVVVTIELLFDIAQKHTPWPFKFIARAVQGGIQKVFTREEFRKDLSWLESELEEKGWFNGDRLGRADVMLSWPMDNIAQHGWIDFAKDYPRIAAWRKRIEERDAWNKGLEKGNGYDLTAV